MLLTLLASLVAVPPVLLLMALCVELIFGTPRGRIRPVSPRAEGSAPRTAIIMPAHNEAAGIAPFIKALQPKLGPNVRLVVVADNCADDTAAVARAAGATVVERFDADRRGKGYALDFGRAHLMAEPPDCVIVLDADCELEGDSLARLADHCVATGRPVQSCYLMRSRPSDAAMVQISNFAMLIKNLVRQRGAHRIGAPAVLGGTGMAFPWALFKDAPLATSHLVEDLVLGIDFARAGHGPVFLPSARTWSQPSSAEGTKTQRTRWEHGFLQTAFGQALPLMGEGLVRGRWGLFWLGTHLFVPPLALLMMIAIAALGLSGLLALLGASPVPFALLAAMLMIATLALALAWAREGRETVQAGTLARIPLYVLWKIPVYLKLVRGRETEWVRTERTGD